MGNGANPQRLETPIKIVRSRGADTVFFGAVIWQKVRDSVLLQV
jgi:hypothetical protein